MTIVYKKKCIQVKMFFLAFSFVVDTTRMSTSTDILQSVRLHETRVVFSEGPAVF